MSRFRRWLIRRLGGHTRQIRLGVTKELRPIHTLTAALEYNPHNALECNLGAEYYGVLKESVAKKLAYAMLERNLIKFENRMHELNLDYVLEGKVFMIQPKD